MCVIDNCSHDCRSPHVGCASIVDHSCQGMGQEIESLHQLDLTVLLPAESVAVFWLRATQIF